jgi:hypothetical protein
MRAAGGCLSDLGPMEEMGKCKMENRQCKTGHVSRWPVFTFSLSVLHSSGVVTSQRAARALMFPGPIL